MVKLLRLFKEEIIMVVGLLVVVTPVVIKYFYDGIIHQDLSFLLMTIAFLCLLLMLFTGKKRFIMFNMAFLFFSLAMAEKYLLMKKNSVVNLLKLDIPSGFSEYDDILGYKPGKNKYSRFVGHYADTLLFDVHISTDEYGFRKTPNVTPTPETKSIVFMGCSFPFGYGVADSAVMPNIVQKNLGNKYKVYNLGYQGYGTHQLLAMAESNVLDTLLEFEPRYFIYPLIDDHLNRIKGYNFWNYYSNEPKYELNTETGQVIRNGRMHNEGMFYKKVIDSEIAKLVTKNKADSTDIGLLIGIAQKTKTILKTKFPNSQFKILFWNAPTPLSQALLRELRANKFDSILITDIIPNYYNELPQYCIKFPYEVHPNFELNKAIAQYMTEKVIQP